MFYFWFALTVVSVYAVGYFFGLEKGYRLAHTRIVESQLVSTSHVTNTKLRLVNNKSRK